MSKESTVDPVSSAPATWYVTTSFNSRKKVEAVRGPYSSPEVAMAVRQEMERSAHWLKFDLQVHQANQVSSLERSRPTRSM